MTTDRAHHETSGNDQNKSIPPVVSLESEWGRISMLITLLESVRHGLALPDRFEERMDGVCTQVLLSRQAGSWDRMKDLVPEQLLHSFMPIDLDILSLSLTCEAVPSLAPRMQALQPQVHSPLPSLALLQEIFILDTMTELDELLSRFRPDAPLMASGLVNLARQDSYQYVVPTARLLSGLTGNDLRLGAPPGTHPVTTPIGWDELILPKGTKAMLKRFVAWIENRDMVFSEWKGRRIGGPLALFSGASGVGKSVAGSAIATHLKMPLYVVDLGRIMSKYIGETEQNLNNLLDALDGRPAILQIDEADALLGKRGEISDARDRYSNLEVSHLLSRIERHNGPIILTTNLRANLDPAFQRRFQFIIDFPKPDSSARSRLWQNLLPANAVLADDVLFERLGESANLTGGGIHNAAIGAAMLAACDGGIIDNKHIASACWQELSKANRQIKLSEIGALAPYLEEAGS